MSPASRTAPVLSQIAGALKTTQKSVLKWGEKALQMGVKAAMKDTPHKLREARRARLVHLACS